MGVTDVVTTEPVVCALVVAPAGEVGLLVGRVNAVGALVDGEPKVVGGAKVAVVVTTDVVPPGVVGPPLALVTPTVVDASVVPAVGPVVASVGPAVGPDGAAVVEGPDVAADVTNVVGGPDDAEVG